MLFPSSYYMGFKMKWKEGENDAVNIDGNKIKGLKWAKTMKGDYKGEISYVVADMAWQKRSQG